MEECKTKHIESSLTAFRAIKTFVFMKGAYPRNFDTGFWDESDYDDPDLRRSMRDEYEQHLEMLAFVYNNYVKTLYEAIPHVESEYNSLVINSRNMEQAVKLFRDKYEEAMIVVENELDTNRLLRNYLTPLKKHGVITFNEGNDYQELVCRIGIMYNDAVHVVCKVFGLERPWNQVMSNVVQIPQQNSNAVQNTEETINSNSVRENDEHKKATGIDLSSRVSFKPVRDDGPNLEGLYRFLVSTKVICNMDQETFESCVSHAYFSPLFREGNKVNILYTISQLKNYYDDSWLDAVCEDLNVNRKRITQRPPSDDFRKGFPSLKLQK